MPNLKPFNRSIISSTPSPALCAEIICLMGVLPSRDLLGLFNHIDILFCVLKISNKILHSSPILSSTIRDWIFGLTVFVSQRIMLRSLTPDICANTLWVQPIIFLNSFISFSFSSVAVNTLTPLTNIMSWHYFSGQTY